MLILQKSTQFEQSISTTLLLHTLPLFIKKKIGAYVLGVNYILLSWYSSLCYHQKNPRICLLVKGYTSERCQLLIFDTVIIAWVNFQSSTPYLSTELSSGIAHSSVSWKMIRVQRGFNCWLLRYLLLTNLPNPAQSSATFFCTELSLGTAHSSVCWYSLRCHKGVHFWMLWQLLLTESSLYISSPVFVRISH